MKDFQNPTTLWKGKKEIVTTLCVPLKVQGAKGARPTIVQVEFRYLTKPNVFPPLTRALTIGEA